LEESSVARRPVTQPAAAFPGATAVTVLDVYDWMSPDGVRGGSAHVHLASTEGYVVLSGTGRLQTLGSRGYAETPLRAGDCLWFSPGVIHRLVNEGDLRLLVVMQNAGLPEAGDAVLTFPPEVLADPEGYAAAASLTGDSLTGASLTGGSPADRARQRRDLAIEGYLALRERVAQDGPGALDGFFAAALRLVAWRVPDWRERWQTGALGTAELTGDQLDRISSGELSSLSDGGLWQIERPSEAHGYGMCGMLTRYDPAEAGRVL
jgi:mannose-6-phosphate isomerase-like protein (cupin superfamily)